MSREIKFRAWHKKLKLMAYFYLFEEPIFPTRPEMPHWITELEIMQFTGLKDKNGKEIYEGDIFRFYSPTFEKTFCHQIKYPYDFTMLACRGEVIGNIYENKEVEHV